MFADEAGDFGFNTKAGSSQFFAITTVASGDCKVGDDLLALRRKLGWRGKHLDRVPHACRDPYDVRAEIFDLISRHDFRIDCTLLEKRKAQPHLHTDHALYKMAWYLHLNYVAPRIAQSSDRLFVIASELGTKKRRGIFHNAVDAVTNQVSTASKHRVAFWPCTSDPCLIVADYCMWAIQRKWERGDEHFYKVIAPKIRSEANIWAGGAEYYY